MQLWILGYNILIHTLIIVLSPFYLYKIATNNRYRKGLGLRLGIGKVRNVYPSKTWLWVHAASVGEMRLAILIIKEIKKRSPEYAIILTAFTDTGYELAVKEVDEADIISYLPLDLIWITKHIINRFNLRAFIMIESELWPNLLYSLKRRHGTKVILVNGRMSYRAYSNYKRLLFFTKRLFQLVDNAYVRTETDKERFITLGLPPERVILSGNIKFDSVITTASLIQSEEESKAFFLDKGYLVIVFGCTREGEERLLTDVFKGLLSRYNTTIVIILAPRHIERIREIEDILTNADITYQLVSNIKWANNRISNFILIDTIGDLFRCYSFCDIAFIGGSLLPFGGHNILEPAVFSKPILFGRYMDNFELEANELLKAGGAVQVSSISRLIEAINALIDNPHKRQEMGRKALGVVNRHKGALQKTMELIGRVVS